MAKTLVFHTFPGSATDQLVTWAQDQPMLEVRKRRVLLPDIRWAGTSHQYQAGHYPAYEVTIVAPDDAPIDQGACRGTVAEWGVGHPWTNGAPMVYIAHAPREVVDSMIAQARAEIDAWDAYVATWTPPAPPRRSLLQRLFRRKENHDG